MQLIRFGPRRQEKPGVLSADGKRRDLSTLFEDWDGKFLEQGGLARLVQGMRSIHPESLPEVPQTARWGAPVARPGKSVCIGLNYSDHAKESGMPIPSEPVVFMKAPNTIVGPYDEIQIPRGSNRLGSRTRCRNRP